MNTAEQSELAAVLARVAELEARLAAADNAKKPDPEYMRTADGVVHQESVERTFANFKMRPELTKTTPLRELRGYELPQGYRDLRRLAAAVAICKGDPVPGSDIPRTYVGQMRALYKALKKGLSWRAAMVAVGLEPPSEAVVAERARTIRGEVSPLWELLRPAVGLLSVHGKGVAGTKARETVQHLLI